MDNLIINQYGGATTHKNDYNFIATKTQTHNDGRSLRKIRDMIDDIEKKCEETDVKIHKKAVQKLLYSDLAFMNILFMIKGLEYLSDNKFKSQEDFNKYSKGWPIGKTVGEIYESLDPTTKSTYANKATAQPPPPITGIDVFVMEGIKALSRSLAESLLIRRFAKRMIVQSVTKKRKNAWIIKNVNKLYWATIHSPSSDKRLKDTKVKG